MTARRLHLLRHAKSSWDDATLPDHERPLAPRGRRAGAAIARHMRSAGIEPEVVLCSDSARTVQTLALIRGALGAAREEVEPGLYAAGAAGLLARVREVEDSVSSVLVIGHNPAMRDLALELAASGERLGDLRAKFPTAALATLEFDGAWTDLGPGVARLAALVKPRELE